MKLATYALLAGLAGFATTAARADHGRINVGVAVAVAPTYSVPAYYPPTTNYYPAAPVVRGHWDDVTVKTWIPGRWITSRDRWGRPVQVFENGRYAFRTERVWVDGRSRGNDYYGYNDNNRRDWNR